MAPKDHQATRQGEQMGLKGHLWLLNPWATLQEEQNLWR
jgi:hypothetical protein